MFITTAKSVRRTAGAAATVIFAMLAGTAQAETISVGYYSSDKHPLVSGGLLSFVEEVETRTNGEITFKLFPAGQLFKPRDSVRSVAAGIADMTQLVIPYHREEFPYSQAINLPHGWGPWELTNTYIRASTQDGLIRDEWKKNNLVPLVLATNPSYEFHTIDTPLNSPADIKGMKVRSSGGVIDDVVQSMGATPINITTPETFAALERKTIDATIYAFSNWKGLNLQEVLGHTTLGVPLPGPSGIGFAISSAKFNALTPEQQSIMLDAGRNASVTAQTQILELNVKALEEFKAGGLKVYEWSSEDIAAMTEGFGSIVSSWVAAMDTNGLDGNAVIAELGAFHDAADDPKAIPAFTAGN